MKIQETINVPVEWARRARAAAMQNVKREIDQAEKELRSIRTPEPHKTQIRQHKIDLMDTLILLEGLELPDED